MEWLRSNDVPYVAVNLEPVFGSIDAYPGTIEGAVRRLEQATGLSPLIVAHSMGGLAVRAWLHLHGGDARVSRVITIASPHAGTWLARFGVTVNARQMRVRSSWLLRLVALEPASRYRRFVCYYSHCDNIVLPASTATLPGADNRHVPGTAHVELVHHKRIWLDVLAELRGGSTVPSAAIDAPKSSVA
jgi:pimeloyl-ACP methyl ester carboxylesterase